MQISFRLENNDVHMYDRDDGGQLGTLGTILPDNEQILRVIARAFEAGRRDKAREIREILGCK